MSDMIRKKKSDKQAEFETALVEIVRKHSKPSAREIARIYMKNIGKEEVSAAESSRIVSKVYYALVKHLEKDGVLESKIMPDENSRLGKRIFWLKSD